MYLDSSFLFALIPLNYLNRNKPLSDHSMKKKQTLGMRFNYKEIQDKGTQEMREYRKGKCVGVTSFPERGRMTATFLFVGKNDHPP
jgi:hypothetical protein